MVLYGAPWCPDCRRCKQFLGRLRIPYTWIDIDEEPLGAATVRELNHGRIVIPTIMFPDGGFLANPDNPELAARVGGGTTNRTTFHELVIIGAGPAGLTAALYGAGAGIDCLVLEPDHVWAEADRLPHIDDYPGLPGGISRAALCERLALQVEADRVEILAGAEVTGLARRDRYLAVSTAQGAEHTGRAVIVATGCSFRRLDVPGEQALIGRGVSIGGARCGPWTRQEGTEVMVVGGGEPGLRTSLSLTRYADLVRLVEPSPELTAPSTLLDKARTHPKVSIHTDTEVVAFHSGAGGRLGAVSLRHRGTGLTTQFTPTAVFVYAGARPNADFLAGLVDRDPLGFVTTDETLQTSLPGVFASGDVRAGSLKGASSAVAEGAAALLMARQYLGRLGDIDTGPSPAAPQAARKAPLPDPAPSG